MASASASVSGSPASAASISAVDTPIALAVSAADKFARRRAAKSR